MHLEGSEGWRLRGILTGVHPGSEMEIPANTFRAVSVAMEGDLEVINRAGVKISKRGAVGRTLVFASIGPTGRMLMAGEICPEQASAAFSAQAAVLVAAGADALLVERMSEMDEARLAVAAAGSTGLSVIVSFAFDSGKNKDRTTMGVTPEAAVMVEMGAAAVGANCGVGVEHVVPICRRLHTAFDLPIWIRPNAGLPSMEGTAIRYGASAKFFASHYAALREAGASFPGGCCGSTPDFIRALVRARCASS